MMMSVVSSVAMLRCTVTGTRLASSSGPRLQPDDLDLKRRRIKRCDAGRGHHGEGIHHVEDADQRRHHGLGNGDDAHMERLRSGLVSVTRHIRVS